MKLSFFSPWGRTTFMRLLRRVPSLPPRKPRNNNKIKQGEALASPCDWLAQTLIYRAAARSASIVGTASTTTLEAPSAARAFSEGLI